jgi:acyl dehydratase
MRYFEDLNIGETASFGSYHVTREEVLAFAQRYDPQPFHLSDEAAAKTHFGRMSASGWHSCAMSMSMLVAHMKEHPQASLGAAGIDELRWLKPVHPGDTLRCE